MPTIALLLGGCAASPGVVPTTSRPFLAGLSAPGLSDRETPEACRDHFQDLDRLVDRAGVRDAQQARIDQRPYLRVNRLLAALPPAQAPEPALNAWIERAAKLDHQARRGEIANLALDAAMKARLQTRSDRCRGLLTRADLAATPEEKRRWISAAAVPDPYQPWMRVAGLYWLTAWPMRAGVARLHQEIHATHEAPVSALPVEGELLRYTEAAPGSTLRPEQIQRIVRAAADNPLMLPLPDDEQAARLFAAFAPVWEIDVAGEDDRPGAPGWAPEAETPHVDSARPMVHHHISHTLVDGQPLLQLNYIIWFPSRPAQSALDLLAGNFDGITWRVTLGTDGRPLLYDTIHNCGCYHLFFPGPTLSPREAGETLSEPALAPGRLNDPRPGERVVLRISSVAHFVIRARLEPEAAVQPDVVLTVADYGQLRSLPWGENRRRSLFDPEGMVPGSERIERWLFWPMGIPNAGAMRQWGQHATAFFGHRLFDDPHLVERYFSPRLRYSLPSRERASEVVIPSTAHPPPLSQQ